jgi:hypothetical protein
MPDSIVAGARVWAHIWCESCQAVRPVVIDYMEAGGENPHDAADLICAECRFVITTLHGPSREG